MDHEAKIICSGTAAKDGDQAKDGRQEMRWQRRKSLSIAVSWKRNDDIHFCLIRSSWIMVVVGSVSYHVVEVSWLGTQKSCEHYSRHVVMIFFRHWYGQVGGDDTSIGKDTYWNQWTLNSHLGGKCTSFYIYIWTMKLGKFPLFLALSKENSSNGGLQLAYPHVWVVSFIRLFVWFVMCNSLDIW